MTFRDHRHSPEEVQRVIRAAVERMEPGRAPAGAEHLTQQELEDHATALGISPGLIREIQLDPSDQKKGSGEKTSFWTGLPVPIVEECEVDRELSEESVQAVFDTVGFVTGDSGRVTLSGNQRIWTPESRYGEIPRPLSVRVLVRNGRTQIRIEERLTGLAGGLIAGVGVGAGLPLAVAIAVLGSVFGARNPAVGLGILFFATLLFIMRAVVRGVVARRGRQLQELQRRLAIQLVDERMAAVSQEKPSTRVRAVAEPIKHNDHEGVERMQEDWRETADSNRLRARD